MSIWLTLGLLLAIIVGSVVYIWWCDRHFDDREEAGG